MRFIFATFVGLVVSSVSFAVVPPELARLQGKQGAFDFERNRGRCEIELSRSGGSVSLAVKTNVEWGGVIFDAEKLRPLAAGTYQTNSTGRRPGGDQCGDYGGMVGFKEIVQVKNNALVVTQSFRCSLELFKSYELVRTCSF